MMNQTTTQENINRFFQTWNKITSVFASMEYYREDPGLTKIELLTLTIVSNKKELIMSQLAGNLVVSMSTATVIIDKLLEKKLVKRERDHGDRRIVKVKLTAKGEKTAKSFQKQKKQIIGQVLGSLSLEEQGNLISILEKISKEINGVKKNEESKH
jgi:DNA-binding MarR family transcriptional regulator